MAITITLDDDLIAGLEHNAKLQRLTVEQFAIHVLTAAAEESGRIAVRSAVMTIQATAPNPTQVRPATENLADVLRAAPGDPTFDLENWNRQWSAVEAEMKAITRANDIMEERGGKN